jgi:hypothetical protein
MMAQPSGFPRVELAAYNNAIWCNTICRAHGIPGEFYDQLWLSRQPVPRFYPNAVIFALPPGMKQLIQIQKFLAEALPGSAAVKDSFCRLELGPLAFRLLFEATWLWRAAGLEKPVGGLADCDWAIVRDAAELDSWETAWNGSLAGEHAPPPERVFPPTLLADTSVVFIAAYQSQRIVAGVIANRTDDVVGLSNVFAPDGAAARFWPGCISAAMDVFPKLPMVGYERGDELVIAQALGFEALGPLRVWVRTLDGR